MKFYNLNDAIKFAKSRTKGAKSTLYIYPKPSVNGLFVDWEVEGMKFSDKTPTATVTNGKVTYNRDVD